MSQGVVFSHAAADWLLVTEPQVFEEGADVLVAVDVEEFFLVVVRGSFSLVLLAGLLTGLLGGGLSLVAGNSVSLVLDGLDSGFLDSDLFFLLHPMFVPNESGAPVRESQRSKFQSGTPQALPTYEMET